MHSCHDMLVLHGIIHYPMITHVLADSFFSGFFPNKNAPHDLKKWKFV